MKFYLSLIVMGIFCTENVKSYISASVPGGATPWKNGAKPSFAQTPPPNIQSDDIFRQEYHAWAKRYGKSTSDETRFENFKLNFMLQMQHNKKTGIFNLLNEFGDMTAKEFEENNNSNATKEREIETATTKSVESSDNVVEVELIVDEESVPRVRSLDSGSIPRVTPFGSPTSSNYDRYRQQHQARRTQKVSLDASPARPRYSSRDMSYDSTRRQNPAYVSRDPQRSPTPKPRVYRQDQVNVPPPQPRRKRRLVRVGPDQIL